MQGHLKTLLCGENYLESSFLTCSSGCRGERDGWKWVEWANGSLLQRGTDAFIFLPSVGRRRNTVFLFQCERLCFRFDIQNRSLAKAKVKPGSKFLGRVMGLLEVFNKRLDGYQEWYRCSCSYPGKDKWTTRCCPGAPLRSIFYYFYDLW